MGWRAAFIALVLTLVCAAPASAVTLTVTSSADPGGSCTGTTCTTLRAAIAEAGRLTGADLINVPAGVINITDDYVINSQITIIGAGARTTIIDGGAKYRGFRISGEGALNLARFTIRNGAAGGGGFADGGGIYNAGNLAIIDVRITDSRAVRGAGIANNLGVIQADNLLVDNNVATGAGGGGIHNTGGSELANQDGWLLLTDSTIFKNSATGTSGVGGIDSSGNGALITLSRTTIADNVGGLRGAGGFSPTGSSAAVATILARNVVGGGVVNCGDTKPTDSGFNVEDERDCTLAPGAMKPELATELSNQGGQLDVLTITTDSDAFNLLPGTNEACTGTDQRALARPKGGACEAGAVELNAGASVRITEGPTGTVTSNDVEFRFQDSGGDVTVQCDLTGPGQTAGFETCYKSNAQPYTDLPDGPYTFSVRAVSAEFPNPPVTTRTFVVNEAGPPNTTITGGPTGLTNDPTPTFTFTSTEPGSTFQCRVGATAGFVACTSPHTVAAQTDGAKTFEVRAIDAAGAVDPTPAARSFTVDATAPDTTIGSGPTGPTASTSATFAFTSNEPGATFQCALDGAAFAACPVSYTGLAQGSHTFQVRAVDAAGNVDATPASRTWTADTIAPTVTIAASPARTNNPSPSFTFTANEAATFQCRSDAGNFAPCTSPYSVVLSEGSHTVEIRATDAAGNPGAPASRAIVIDITAPAVTINSGPTGATSDNTPTFAFSSEAGATFECRVDSAAFAGCTSPHTTAALVDGARTFQVRAVDTVGNTGAATTRTFRVDTTRPDTTVVSGPSGVTNDTTPTWGFSSDESPVTYLCSVDGATATACPNPFTAATLAPGAHTLSVRAVDEAGNIDSTPATRSITVDTTAPTVTITSGPPARTNDTTPTFVFTADANATVQCRIDAGTFATCTSGYTPTVTAEGSHTFEVRATTPAGNSATDTWSFITDISAPDTTITGGPAPSSDDTSPQFTFTSTEAGTFQCSLDGAAFTGCNSPHFPGTLALGQHTYRVRSIDLAGNTDATPAARTFVIVDTVAPPAPEVQGPSGATSDPNPAFTFASAETTVECRLDGPTGAGSYAACLSPKTFSALAPGDYVFFVRVTEPSGLQAETRRPFTVTVPQVQAAQTPTPTPTPQPTPVPNQTIVVTPAKVGTVLVKEKGSSKFEPLDVTKGIKNGSEVDVRNGRVTLTSIPKVGAPPETADFYGGMFIVTQKGGITDLKLSERLTGCPKGQQASLSLAQKKPKSRKLWGNGKGAFRTSGKYSAATVRGTIWLVQDSCTTTLTRVTQGVVQVNDFVKKKKQLVKKGKRYTAKAKKR